MLEINVVIFYITNRINGGTILDFIRLEKNMIDVMKEEQVKLGYTSETVRLYYPILSLNRLLNTDLNVDQMHAALKVFRDIVGDKLGKISVSNRGERFCFTIPPQGVDYVHAHMDSTEFICDFVGTIAKHGTIDDVLQQFHKHSDRVHVEEIPNGEFHYLVYFEDGVPDNFRYCITNEDGHINYHRFTIEDYTDFLV